MLADKIKMCIVSMATNELSSFKCFQYLILPLGHFRYGKCKNVGSMSAIPDKYLNKPSGHQNRHFKSVSMATLETEMTKNDKYDLPMTLESDSSLW